MVAAALLWLVIPLWQRPSEEDQQPNKSEQRVSTIVVAVLVPSLAVALYVLLSNWNWSAAEQQIAQSEQMDDLLEQLQERMKENPQDLDGWLLLGRSHATMGRYQEAAGAYQHAYDLSKGESLEATIGLGEALSLSDETALAGRAGELFEEALAKAPNHPKALWYGSVAALQAGDLKRGRDRLQALLAQNPPAELQTVLQRQIDALNEQIGEGEQSAASSTSGTQSQASPARSIQVAVSIAPALQQQIAKDLPLFVLARDPAGGPPLAVQKHSAASLPLTVTLSDKDAMMASRTISTVPRVQVVARLSRNGNPQAQSGDFFGEAAFDFGKDTGTLNIIIDRTVP